jgi:hypothetical protein
MFRRSLATALTILLTGISLPGQTSPIGAITQSTGGHLNNTAASVGTTIYAGDRLSTEVGGALTLRSGPVQLTLAEDSVVYMNQDGGSLSGMLQRGSVVFRVESGGSLKIDAVDVRVRPQSHTLTAGQVTLENCNVVVTSRVQSLEVTAGKETKIIEEGKSYRVSIPGACGGRSSNVPQPAVHGRFLAIPIAIGVITVIGVQEALESPDRP